MCDLEGCTTGTIGLPNPNQRSVAKTSGFLHPYIYRYAALAFLRERFLALEGEGITRMGEPSRQGIALFSERIEFWRSTGMEFRAIHIVSYKHNECAELDQIWQEDIPGAYMATGPRVKEESTPPQARIYL